MHKSLALLLSLVFISTIIFARPKVKIPPLEKRVTDHSYILKNFEIARIEKGLSDFEKVTGSQIIVVIIPTTGDESIEEFSIRLAEKWKIGRKGVDDGVILLIAKRDRKVRIEVGYGLEGAIPDAVAAMVIDDYIVPHFKNSDFVGGVEAGLEKIMDLINGEILPPPGLTEESDTDTSFANFIMLRYILGQTIMFAGLVAGFILFIFFAKGKKKHFLIVVFGGVAVILIGAIMASLFFGLLYIFFLLFVGFAMRQYAVKGGFHSSSSYRSSSGSTNYLSSRSSWSSGSSSFGSSYSGGSSGFSGGGGSFGGGGASGSW